MHPEGSLCRGHGGLHKEWVLGPHVSTSQMDTQVWGLGRGSWPSAHEPQWAGRTGALRARLESPGVRQGYCPGVCHCGCSYRSNTVGSSLSKNLAGGGRTPSLLQASAGPRRTGVPCTCPTVPGSWGCLVVLSCPASPGRRAGPLPGWADAKTPWAGRAGVGLLRVLWGDRVGLGYGGSPGGSALRPSGTRSQTRGVCPEVPGAAVGEGVLECTEGPRGLRWGQDRT